jgi:hypothetical protein
MSYRDGSGTVSAKSGHHRENTRIANWKTLLIEYAQPVQVRHDRETALQPG